MGAPFSATQLGSWFGTGWCRAGVKVHNLPNVAQKLTVSGDGWRNYARTLYRLCAARGIHHGSFAGGSKSRQLVKCGDAVRMFDLSCLYSFFSAAGLAALKVVRSADDAKDCLKGVVKAVPGKLNRWSVIDYVAAEKELRAAPALTRELLQCLFHIKDLSSGLLARSIEAFSDVFFLSICRRF